MATVGVRMGKRNWIFVGVIAFALVVFLGWAFGTLKDRDWEREEKIKDLEDRVARLQQELEKSPKQVASLRAGSDENTRARRSAQRTVNDSRREAPRVADRIPSPEPSFYEAVRSTAVFEEPSASSRELASIPKGSRVRVVGSTGKWLEVRSTQGKPPGFIRIDDAVLMR